MQQRIIYPDKDKWNELKLTPEEERVYNRFDADDFPIEWEMYIHPHLNGLRPDLVLLHPKYGIAVYEFKDWDFSTIQNAIELDLTIHNPLVKVELYEKELLEFYCPRLGAKYGSNYSPAITAGIIFTEVPQMTVDSLKTNFINRLKTGRVLVDASGVEVKGLVNRLEKFSKYYPIIGVDNIHSLDKLFPCRKPNLTSYKMEESASIIPESEQSDTAADLRAWLTETEHWTPLSLNTDQEEIATRRTPTGYRWVEGPAGSGRSVALTARAVELDRIGKRVLVCTYNITLVNYLHYLVARHVLKQEFFKRHIDIFHFHDWCKRVCRAAGRGGDYTKLWTKVKEAEEAMEQTMGKDNNNYLKQIVEQERDEVLNVLLPELVQDIYKNPPKSAVLPFYDAILIDEGQDFRLSWWKTLQSAVVSDGEMLLVADKTQDIYRNKNWLDGPKPGFSSWKGLKTNYRLPPKLTNILANFADLFLPIDVNIPSQGVLDLYPVELRWVQIVSQIPSVDVCFEEAIRQRNELKQKGSHEFSDITFLSAYRNMGSLFVEKCKEAGIGVRDTFGKSYDESRCKKLLFFSMDSRMKATTLHSFKGLESRHLVVYVDRIDRPEDLALLYVGLTRLKTHPNGSMLTVVSSCPDPDLYNFGERKFSPNFFPR